MLKFIKTGEKNDFSKSKYGFYFQGYWTYDDYQYDDFKYIYEDNKSFLKENTIEDLKKYIEQILKFYNDNQHNIDDEDVKWQFEQLLDKAWMRLPLHDERVIDVLENFYIVYYDENGIEYDVSFED